MTFVSSKIFQRFTANPPRCPSVRGQTYAELGAFDERETSGHSALQHSKYLRDPRRSADTATKVQSQP